MAVDVGDVVRIVAEWDIPDGTIAQMVWHFIGISGSSSTDVAVLNAAEAALQAAWANIAARIDDTVLGSTVEGFRWDFTLNQWDGMGQVPLIGADGTATDEMLPHGAAGLVKIFTDAARRQARKYVPGFGELAQGNGTLIGAAVTDLALFASDLDDIIFPGNLVMHFGVFSTDPASALFETFSETRQSVQAEAIMAYQRRRRPGTGI